MRLFFTTSSHLYVCFLSLLRLFFTSLVGLCLYFFQNNPISSIRASSWSSEGGKGTSKDFEIWHILIKILPKKCFFCVEWVEMNIFVPLGKLFAFSGKIYYCPPPWKIPFDGHARVCSVFRHICAFALSFMRMSFACSICAWLVLCCVKAINITRFYLLWIFIPWCDAQMLYTPYQSNKCKNSLFDFNVTFVWRVLFSKLTICTFNFSSFTSGFF